jgi:antitoxin (DNA-binding transcriptional repressor) of toxin-antitoxin stability system
MRILDVSKVRGSLAEIVEGVRERSEVVIIIRYRQPIAALVPIERLTASELKTLRSIDRGTGRRATVRRGTRA